MSSNTNVNIADALVRGVPNGSILYKIYAVPDPNTPSVLEYLGYIQTTSPFHASAFGDLTLFFKHTFIEEDFKYHPEWQDFLSVTAHLQSEGRAVYEPYLPAF
jgi:hypothetical protein